MIINGRQIGEDQPPYIIAEAASEHCGSFERALRLIEAAKEAGASAIKFQLYDPARIAEARGGKDKILTDGLWKGRTLGDLYLDAHTPREWFPKLFEHAERQLNITAFSSVFDEQGVDFLETLNCPAYKISSFDLTNLALIRKAVDTDKPVIISTGMGNDEDIARACGATKPGNRCFLYCTSAYPCSYEDTNLGRMRRDLIDGATGYGFSDHTLGWVAPVVATALGAEIIEKHLTLYPRKDGGPDAFFSLEPNEFKDMVDAIKAAHASLGTGERPKSEDLYRSLRVKG